MTDYHLEPVTETLFFVKRISFNYNYSALQVGATLPLAVSDTGLAVLSGSLAFPSTGMGEERIVDVGGNIGNRRNWDADTYYATLEGLYAHRVHSGFYALGGFRWSYWQTSYKNWQNQAGYWNLADTDTGDITINAYLPLVGVMTRMGSLGVGAIGFPTTLGTAQSRWNDEPRDLTEFTGTFDGGYFAEAFLEYVVPFTTVSAGLDASVSFFGKISSLRVRSTMSLNMVDNFAPFGTELFNLVFQRNLFVLGAKASLNFTIPDLLNL